MGCAETGGFLLIDAITHQLGKLLIKAIGDEDDMFAWDKFRRKPPVKMNPARFIEANPEKVDAYLNPGGVPRLIDIPLEMDYDLPIFEDVRGDLPANLQSIKPAKFGHYGEPGKMPGPSIMDSPPRACIYANRENPNMACGNCYACRGNYAYPNVQVSQWRNLDRMLNYPEQIGAAYAETLTPTAMLARKRPTDDINARIFSAGNARGSGAFAMADQIARRNPMVDMWMSTRQIPYLYDFLEARGFEPDAIAPNLAIQMSLPGRMLPEQVKDDTDITFTSKDVPSRTINVGELSRLLGADGKPMLGMTGFDKIPSNPDTICRATIPGNPKKCDLVTDPLTGELGCRACFRRGGRSVYLENQRALSNLPPTMREMALENIFEQMRD